MPGSSSWIHDLTAADVPWKALFFPHSGGSPDSYRALAARLSGVARSAGVQYPGRTGHRRSPLFTDVHALADEIAEAFAAWHEDEPVLLFGHSLGALVAYEVLRRTPEQDRMMLVASGHPAPSRLVPPLLDDTDESNDFVVELVTRLGGEGPELLAHPVLRQIFLPVIRSDLTAHSRYRAEPGSRIACPIIALIGEADPLTSIPDTLAWQQHTSATLRIHTFPGDHFFVHQYSDEVVAVLRDELNRRASGCPPL